MSCSLALQRNVLETLTIYTDDNYPDLTEGVGAGSVSGRHEGLETDLTHEVLVNLKQTSELNGDLIY